MDLQRLVRHLMMPQWRIRRVFSRTMLARVEREIAHAEIGNSGQIRFAVEAALDALPLLSGETARERALEVFSQLRVWDTEQNNGVLIYILFADHDVEIVADRGIHARVGAQAWEEICRQMEQAFRAGRFEEGVLAGIRAVSVKLAEHFPRRGPGANELPDVPTVL